MILFPKAQPSLSLMDWVIKTVLRPFASWDGAYFLTIALKGYIYEQEHAFFPLYPLLIRTIAEFPMRPVSGFLSLEARCILSALIISNVSHYVSVRLLYHLGFYIFRDSYFAYLSAVFLTLTPMQAVAAGVYSESLFTCLILIGLTAFYHKRRALAAISWCLAGATRSNGIFLPGFFLYEYIHQLRRLSISVVSYWHVPIHLSFRRQFSDYSD